MTKYIVSIKEGFNAEAVSESIKALAEKENVPPSKRARVTNVFNNIGVIALECGKGFAKVLESVPGVNHVEADKPGFAL